MTEPTDREVYQCAIRAQWYFYDAENHQERGPFRDRDEATVEWKKLGTHD